MSTSENHTSHKSGHSTTEHHNGGGNNSGHHFEQGNGNFRNHGRGRFFGFIGGHTTPNHFGELIPSRNTTPASSNNTHTEYGFGPQQQIQGKPAAHGHIGGDGPGWFDGIIKQFYDPKNGGFQIGGALGALAGAMLGMQFLGTGSWLGILAMGVATLAGAWGGNKLSSTISSYVNHDAPAAEPEKQPTQGKAKAHDAAAKPEPVKGPITFEIKQQAIDAAAAAQAQHDGQDHQQIQGATALPAKGATTAPAQPAPKR